MYGRNHCGHCVVKLDRQIKQTLQIQGAWLIRLRPTDPKVHGAVVTVQRVRPNPDRPRFWEFGGKRRRDEIVLRRCIYDVRRL